MIDRRSFLSCALVPFLPFKARITYTLRFSLDYGPEIDRLVTKITPFKMDAWHCYEFECNDVPHKDQVKRIALLHNGRMVHERMKLRRDDCTVILMCNKPLTLSEMVERSIKQNAS